MSADPAKYPLLSRIESPADIRTLPETQLEALCAELRTT